MVVVAGVASGWKFWEFEAAVVVVVVGGVGVVPVLPVSGAAVVVVVVVVVEVVVVVVVEVVVVVVWKGMISAGMDVKMKGLVSLELYLSNYTTIAVRIPGNSAANPLPMAIPTGNARTSRPWRF